MDFFTASPTLVISHFITTLIGFGGGYFLRLRLDRRKDYNAVVGDFLPILLADCADPVLEDSRFTAAEIERVCAVLPRGTHAEFRRLCRIYADAKKPKEHPTDMGMAWTHDREQAKELAKALLKYFKYR